MRLLRSLLSTLSRAPPAAKPKPKPNANATVAIASAPTRRFAQVHDVRIEYERAPAARQDDMALNGV
jgi:hypothetical protein